jgi:Fe2+ transport system protein B
MKIIFRQKSFRKILLTSVVGLCLLPARPLLAAEQLEGNTLLPPSAIARLDSLRAVSKQYEKAGNYEQAYRAELRRMQVRDSLRAIYLNRLVTQYEENFHNQDLEMTRVRLLDQNVRMEVEQMESAGEVERLREEQDSINIDNARIQLNNATAQEELAEKQRQLQEAEMQRQWDEQRRSVIFLWFVVALILVVLGFCVYFLIVRARLNAVLRNEREQAREALQRAELANRTQNHFMQQFNEVIQQPAEEICAASRTLCE